MGDYGQREVTDREREYTRRTWDTTQREQEQERKRLMKEKESDLLSSSLYRKMRANERSKHYEDGTIPEHLGLNENLTTSRRPLSTSTPPQTPYQPLPQKNVKPDSHLEKLMIEKFDKDVRIVEEGEEKDLNVYLKEKYIDTRQEYQDKSFEFYHFSNGKRKNLQLNLTNLQDYKILELTNKGKVENFYSQHISSRYPTDDVIEYLRDNKAVIQYELLRGIRDNVAITKYNEYLYKRLSEAFKNYSKIQIGYGYYHLVIIFFKKEDGKYYVALNLVSVDSENNNENIFKKNGVDNKTFHHFYYHIMDFNYNDDVKNIFPSAQNTIQTNKVGYNLNSYTPIFLPNDAQSYEEASECAKRKAEAGQTVTRQSRVSRLIPLPRSKEEQQKQEQELEQQQKREQELEQQQGGKKTSKKEVLGKMRCIYKIPGDRKEYVKHKGKLITVKDYKMLNKKPKKVADKKPKRSKK